MKKVRLVLAGASLLVSLSVNAATFQDIQFWVGSGTNQAGFEIDWNDGTTNSAYIWGYRWNGDANGEQMLDAIVAADPRLYAEVSGTTQYGTALFGLGLDHNADQVFPLNPALLFNTNHFAFTDYAGVNDNRTAVDAGDRWQEGWLSAGYWSYWLSTDSRLAEDFSDWDYSGLGMTGRVLANGDWDGWGFAPHFNGVPPADPFPQTNVVDNTPKPIVRLVHGFNSEDGSNPGGELLLKGNTLYGTAGGGTNYNGVIFSVQTNGLAFATLHTFAGEGEGRYPMGALASLGEVLYGTTSDQGDNQSGTVFSLGLDGSNFSTLHTFSLVTESTNSDGALPQCGLTVGNDGSLFGFGFIGGQYGSGTLFSLDSKGESFTNLHSFALADELGVYPEGANPRIELISDGGLLYGVMPYGGANGAGNIFKINADGSGFTILHNFSILDSSTNLDGATPFGRLLLADGVLYGATSYGGLFGNGTVFRINADGSSFTNLHNFGLTNSKGANKDGAQPAGGLVLDGNTLYGVTQYGGKKGQGTIFQINTDGSGFCSLYSFLQLTSGSNDVGAAPCAGLVQSANTFYGTASTGGPNGFGTLFALDLPNPPLSLSITNNQVSVTWPLWAPNFTLEMSTNLSSTNWQVMTPQLSDTNFLFQSTAQGGSAFFRLKK